MPYKEPHIKTMPYDVVINGSKTMKGVPSKELSGQTSTSNNKNPVNTVFKTSI